MGPNVGHGWSLIYEQDAEKACQPLRSARRARITRQARLASPDSECLSPFSSSLACLGAAMLLAVQHRFAIAYKLPQEGSGPERLCVVVLHGVAEEGWGAVDSRAYFWLPNTCRLPY